jgi:hypothetical protein
MLRFEEDVAPILRKHCLRCHGDEKREGELDLRTRDALLKGGTSGSAILPGKSELSLLLRRIASGEMPPEEPTLTPHEVALIRKWVDAGAPKVGEDAEAAKRRLDAFAVSPQEIMVNIFFTNCIECHGKWKQEAGLDLRTRAGMLKGGKSGPALVPGDPEQSLVYQRIIADEMPPQANIFGDEQYVSRVRAADVERLRVWIATGAAPLPPVPEGAVQLNKQLVERAQEHWAFTRPRYPDPPSVQSRDRVRNPIDAFLLRRLEASGLGFSPEADPLTLLRRAHFDLTGLPPSPETVEAHQRASATDPQSAFIDLVDRLLESQHYGERWAVHWLDAAGYSDTHGQINRDEFRPFMWRYRDYVIRSLNADKPYSQFLTEQIAGDEMFDHAAHEALSAEQLDALIATGFLRSASDATDEGSFNKTANRHAVLDEQLDIFSTTVMGLTMECARCHSHKFDPIPQRDYYRFAAIFRAAYDPYDWRIPNHVLHPPKYPVPATYQRYLYHESDVVTPPVKQYNGRLEMKIAELEEKLSAAKDAHPATKRSPPETNSQTAELERLQRELDALRAQMLTTMRIHGLTDTGGPATPVFVLRRGEIHVPGDRVTAGVPAALGGGLEPYHIEGPQRPTGTSGQRLALAKWMVQPNHPLTSRVIVNRLWQYHFGRGLVDTPANFGRAGAKPSHPELLDWLATELVRRDWSWKELHRLIMTSTAYRQRSRLEESQRAGDPDGMLLSRFPFRRLDAEEVRDSILAVSGQLDTTPFGPPTELQIDEGGEVTASASSTGYRRSVYLARKRKTAHTLLELFDSPAMVPNCVHRTQSIVPTQALQLWNSRFVREAADDLANRVADEIGNDASKQLHRIYMTALSRSPSESELQRDLTALAELTRRWRDVLKRTPSSAQPAEPARRALTTFCHTMLNSPEFIYVD